MVVHQIGHQPPTAQAVYAVFLPAAVVIAVIACVISPITAHNAEAFAKGIKGLTVLVCPTVKISVVQPFGVCFLFGFLG